MRVFLVHERDGGVRLCNDYRKVNELSVKDACPLPTNEECLDHGEVNLLLNDLTR